MTVVADDVRKRVTRSAKISSATGPGGILQEYDQHVRPFLPEDLR